MDNKSTIIIVMMNNRTDTRYRKTYKQNVTNILYKNLFQSEFIMDERWDSKVLESLRLRNILG